MQQPIFYLSISYMLIIKSFWNFVQMFFMLRINVRGKFSFKESVNELCTNPRVMFKVHRVIVHLFHHFLAMLLLLISFSGMLAWVTFHFLLFRRCCIYMYIPKNKNNESLFCTHY